MFNRFKSMAGLCNSYKPITVVPIVELKISKILNRKISSKKYFKQLAGNGRRFWLGSVLQEMCMIPVHGQGR